LKEIKFNNCSFDIGENCSKYFCDKSQFKIDGKQFNLLSQWYYQITRKELGMWKQAFSSSTHGKTAINLHQQCDNRGESFVFVQNQNGYFFGIYTCFSFTSTDQHVTDSSAFIFSLTSKKCEIFPATQNNFKNNIEYSQNVKNYYQHQLHPYQNFKNVTVAHMQNNLLKVNGFSLDDNLNVGRYDNSQFDWKGFDPLSYLLEGNNATTLVEVFLR